MRRREYFWSLFHTTEDNQLDDLRTDQIEAIFAALPKTQHSEWLIWKEGFSDWKPFSDFPQLLLSLRQAPIEKSTPPPLPKKSKDVRTAPTRKAADEELVDFSSPSVTAKIDDEAESETDVSQKPFRISREIRVVDEPIPEDSGLSIDPRRNSDDRGRGRYAKTFDVHIFYGDKVFKTKTVNISVNGMRVQDALPAKLPMYFNVQIRAKDHVIPLICSEVRAGGGEPSTTLKIEANDHPEMLQTLLLTLG